MAHDSGGHVDDPQFITDSGKGETVRRWDRGNLRKATIDDTTGFLHVDASTTRAPAVFPYMRPDGSIRRELRLPGDVFSARNLDSIGKATVTNDHPPVRVTTQNVREYGVGQGDGNVRVDGEHALVGLVVNDADTIADMKAGKRQVSLGYDVRIEPSAGTYDGQEYDVIQRDHHTNHIAIVAQGRAGSTVRAHMDRTDAIQLDEIQERNEMPDTTPAAEAVSTAGVQVDGLDLQLPISQAQHIKAAFDQMSAKVDAATARADKAEAELQAVKDAAPEVTAPDATALQKLVAARVQLLNDAEKIAGLTVEDAKDMTDGEVRRAVVSKALDGKDISDKSDEYVDCYFDIALTNAGEAPTVDGAQKLGDAITGATKPEAPKTELQTVNELCADAVNTSDQAWKIKGAE